MTLADRLNEIIAAVAEFKKEGKVLSANDLIRVLSKRMPAGWKPSQEELSTLKQEILKQQAEDDGDEVPVAESEAKKLLSQPQTRPRLAVTILKLKELLQHHTKEDLIDLLAELSSPKD